MMVSGAGLMVRLSVTLAVWAVGEVESVTLIVTLPLLAAAGVPVMAPVEALIESGVGSPVADQVYGFVPPVAVAVRLYAWPAVPEGSEAVVIVRVADAMLSVSVVLVLCGVGAAESVTLIVTLPLLTAVGVPEITPPELIERPAGKPVADQLYGVVPPVAAIVMLYACPTWPAFRAVVVIVSGAAVTVSPSVALADCGLGEPESVTLMATILELGPAGVPVIAPVDALIERPVGRPVADQLSGGVPPVATMVWL